MNSTQDNVIFNNSISNKGGQNADKPFVNKKFSYIMDNNGSFSYDRNQIEFQTVSFSNGSRFMDYSDGYISIPTVTVLETSIDTGHADVPKANSVVFKSSFLNMIDSINIDYGNVPVVQATANISPMWVFDSHVSYSSDDLVLNDYTGYRKDIAKSWTYSDVDGISNNLVARNTSLVKDTTSSLTADQKKLLTDNNIKASGMDHYEVHGKTHVYYHDCIIRLRDLPFFKSMPIIKGSNIRIRIDLNQSSVTTVRGADDQTSNMNIQLKGSVCPVMRLDPKAGTETLSCRVVSSSGHIDVGGNNGLYVHEKKQCRLYVPSYELNTAFESSYMASRQQKIIYEDVFVKNIVVQPGSFQENITSGLSRVTRLLIVPMLNKNSNGTKTLVSPQGSIYSTEPSTCSPYLISDFNVKVSSNNIYEAKQEYKYESFLNEMNVLGIDANKETGLCSGQIGLKDYINTYGYIVCDLSRRVQGDEMTPFNIDIIGTVRSPKALDLLCFLSYEKDITLDVATGEIL